ncbi:MAG: efflux RND transporter permease subunit [Crocinitomicaceae bacterium]|nr:efflux RND transporter permease subunit [Crocinitomicaceae bacterium]
MRKLITFFVNRPVWGNAFIAVIIIFGIFSLLQTKKSFFPELEPQTIIASVFYPGASPKEMEEGVTIKIEQSIKGLAAIEEINSTSSENLSSVKIKAYQDANMDQLLSDVENAINSINSFPAGAEKPILNKITSGGMGSVVAFIGISARDKRISDIELIDLASKVEQDLLNTKDITEIVKMGFPTKEISINIRENDLVRYNTSFQEVSLAISSQNLNITTGQIRGESQEMNIRSNNRVLTANEISEIVLRALPSGEKVKIKDVADVKLGYSENSQKSAFNGLPAVSFQIEKSPSQDIEKISSALHNYQNRFNEENPDFQFDIYFEFNELLEGRIDLLTKNGLTGLILVLVFLGMFLNIKLSSWVAFGIPFSFLGMFVLGIFYGITINMISLFGMILVVGILVDDGIVIAENIYAHFEKGKSAKQAAIDGTMEVLPSVCSSVITTIVAFSVLFFVEGLEMMREMAFVVIACLIFSILEGIITLPSHLSKKSVLEEAKEKPYGLGLGILFMITGIVSCAMAYYIFPIEPAWDIILFPVVLSLFGLFILYAGFSKSPIEAKVRATADSFIKWFRDHLFTQTVSLLVGQTKRWYRFSFFIPLFFTVFVISLLVNGTLSSTFFPNIQPDFFTIEVAYTPGTNEKETEKFIEQATFILLEENNRIKKQSGDEIMTYYTSNIGFTQNIGQAGNHTGGISVFVNAEDSEIPLDTLMNRINKRINELDQGKIAENLYVGGFNRFGKEIEIGLTSSDDQNLMSVRDGIKKALGQMNGVINIKDNLPPGRNEIQLKMKPQAELFGVSKGEVLNQIRQGFFGQEAQRVIIGTDEIKIWVRYPIEDRNSTYDLFEMKIKNAQGMRIPLREICEYSMGRTPESLKRRNGQRIVKIDAETIDPEEVANINTEIFDSILPKVTSLYPNVQSLKLGQFERSQKTGDSMQYVTLVLIFLMFVILMLHFNSLSQAFLIMLVIPSGIAGSIIGHGLVGIPVSILSVFGMIALIGVLVNDAIVFLDRYNGLLLEGKPIKEAAILAAASRFRPILLTSITTVAGLLPMISETSMQAQFLIPMATSIAFGVLFGTVFILFFYPSAILLWNDRARLGRFIFHGERKSAIDVEPVFKLKKTLKNER